MENESPNTIIDVVGIVESVQGNVTIQKKDGTETNKRSLLLRAETGRSVELSMWGGHAEHPGVELEEARLTCLSFAAAKANMHGQEYGMLEHPY